MITKQILTFKTIQSFGVKKLQDQNKNITSVAKKKKSVCVELKFLPACYLNYTWNFNTTISANYYSINYSYFKSSRTYNFEKSFAVFAK